MTEYNNNIEDKLLNNLSDDYDIGKITIKDLILLLKERFENDYQILNNNNFFYTYSFNVIFSLIKEKNIVAILIIIMLTLFSFIFLLLLLNSTFSTSNNNKNKKGNKNSKKEEEDDEEVIIPRDYTLEQLKEFNGKINPKIFIALKGDVYNVTNATDHYGPGGPYHCFAGRDASRAMAKLSLEEEDLNNPRIDDLGPFERDVLEQWVEKFKYIKQYPIVGKLVNPKKDRLFTLSELKNYKGIPQNNSNETNDNTNDTHGTTAPQSTKNDRVDLEILLAVKGNVYDVSFGGKEHYGPGGSYHIFAGIDASRALAKMSFDPNDVNSSDLTDLTEEQLKILDDWEDKFQNKRLYPIVGKLVSEQNKDILNSSPNLSPNPTATAAATTTTISHELDHKTLKPKQ